MVSLPPRSRWRFGAFEFHLDTHQLLENRSPVRIADQPLQVLAVLIRNAERVVTRQELFEALWPDGTGASKAGLNSAMRRLRLVLHDDFGEPRYIATLPGHGYRFIAPVEAVEAEPETNPAGEATARTATTRRPRLRLRWGVAGASLLVLLTVVAMISARGRTRASLPATPAAAAPAKPRVRSLAVMPFTNLSGDPRQEYVAEQLTDQLTTDLARTMRLRVMSATSTAVYRQHPVGLRQIRRELGVDAVIEGSVARQGRHLRVNVRLVATAPERHLWAHSYDRDTGDLEAAQDEISAAVVAQVANLTNP